MRRADRWAIEKGERGKRRVNEYLCKNNNNNKSNNKGIDRSIRIFRFVSCSSVPPLSGLLVSVFSLSWCVSHRRPLSLCRLNKRAKIVFVCISSPTVCTRCCVFILLLSVHKTNQTTNNVTALLPYITRPPKAHSAPPPLFKTRTRGRRWPAAPWRAPWQGPSPGPPRARAQCRRG